jgi:hypothetical protein
MINPILLASLGIGAGVLSLAGSIAGWYFAKLGNSVLRDEFQRLNRALYMEIHNEIGDEHDSRKQACFDLRDEMFHGHEIVLENLREHIAATSINDAPLVEVLIPTAQEIADSVKERTEARAEHYKKYAAEPAPLVNGSSRGYADCVGCDVVISGPSVGSGKQFLTTLVSDAQGNYFLGELRSGGTYRIQPSKRGKTFTPKFLDVLVNGDTVAPPFVDPSSPVDSRQAVKGFGRGPNSSVVVNGSVQYVVQTSSNPAVPGTDSRVTKPVSCAVLPQNCRK